MKFTRHATAEGSRARAGVIETAHNAIETPVFMPVGTRGTVRTQSLAQLGQLDAPIILANTYHLMRRPGIEAFAGFGGLHRWMGWRGSILTDSGGFQIFSLPDTVIDEDGATVHGERLTPARAIAMQRAIGSDIMMVLDQCIASTSAPGQAELAMHRTHRWAARSLAARRDGDGALFAIVQGACVPALRRTSADTLVELGERAGGFEGYAVGGLAVGEPRAEREAMTELVTERLPADKPRYLMGVGMPIDLLEGVHRGIDMFDCILPTALAQQGVAFTSRGRIDLDRGVHRLSETALDPACACEACARPRSYLHHLIKCKEPLGWQLLAFHNLAFYTRLMADIRRHIRAGSFAAFYQAQRDVLDQADPDHPPGQHPRIKPGKPTARGGFALHGSPRGFTSIQHVASGEIMHSVNEPDVEAARIYVEQSALIAQALAGERPLVVWDVGLGAGHNAMALVRAIEAAPGCGELELVSFERDLDAFRLALDHGGRFPHLRHAAAHVLAHRGRFERDRLRWRLIEADFADVLDAQAPPDVIFYDPFSAKVDTAMWSHAMFARLFARVRARPVELFTYTSSTAIRSAMLAAGFHVARGVASGPKPETTIALTRPLAPHALLGPDWLARRARSAAAIPADVADPVAFEHMIQGHPQFATRV
ncbi:MAG TPA: tRNA guanosine(34) transglycosylase Tgt [Kofleriaceae bacterium]